MGMRKASLVAIVAAASKPNAAPPNPLPLDFALAFAFSFAAGSALPLGFGFASPFGDGWLLFCDGAAVASFA